jgi:histidine triad (HIT) family protein
MSEPSIFTKIIKGEIPSHKVYEDDRTLAFLDIHPIQPGHTLVITKKQVEDFTMLEPEDLGAWMSTVQKVAHRMKEVFPEKRRVGVMIEGLDVPHVHAKVFPIDSGVEYRAEPDSSVEPNHEELAKMAEKLRFE